MQTTQQGSKNSGHHKKAKPPAIVFHSYPSFVYTWPLIFLGLFFSWTEGSLISEAIAGWTYVTVVVMLMLTLGFDLKRNVSVFCIVVILLIWAVIVILQLTEGVVIFGQIAHWIASQAPTLSRGYYRVSAIFLGVIYAVMYIMARLNDRWRITHNEIEHKAIGDRDDAMSRGAKKVGANYPDVLEAIFGFGAGTLVVSSANGTTVLARVPNVIGLWFRYPRISRVLESVAVTNQQDETDDDEHHGGEEETLDGHA